LVDHKYSLDTILYKISKQKVVNWYRKYSKEFIFDEEIDLIDEDYSKNEDLENKLIQMQHLLE